MNSAHPEIEAGIEMLNFPGEAHGMEACLHFLACTQTDSLQLPLLVSSPVYEFMSEDPGMHIGPISGVMFLFVSLQYIYNSVYYIYHTVIMFYYNYLN